MTLRALSMSEAKEQTSGKANIEIPLFYIGGVPSFQPLVQNLSAVHAFENLPVQTSVIRELKNPYSLRCIAEHFAKAIREKRPRGPYMLGGWHAHGVLALETAQLLREQGQDVALLVLLETANPERLRKQRRVIRIMATLQAKIDPRGFEYKYLRSLGEDHAKVYFSGRVGLPSRNSQTARNQKSGKTHTPTTALDILYTAVGNYLPRPYDSPVLLIRGRRGIFGVSRDECLGWDKTFGKELEVCETDRNQHTMSAGPDVQGLVHRVSARLRAAEQRWQKQRRDAHQTA
jgi:thioesterase domain-containing protein